PCIPFDLLLPSGAQSHPCLVVSRSRRPRYSPSNWLQPSWHRTLAGWNPGSPSEEASFLVISISNPNPASPATGRLLRTPPSIQLHSLSATHHRQLIVTRPPPSGFLRFIVSRTRSKRDKNPRDERSRHHCQLHPSLGA
ncbi:hypothetical protein N5P37_002098, partial [Trichoderma harzianum]